MADVQTLIRSNYQGSAYREDILDIIYQITPEDTPFFNMIGDSKATSVMHQWGTRALAARANNAQHEGQQYAIGDYADTNLPTRETNFCQIVRKLPRVTNTQQSMDVHGISDLMADQIAVRSVEFKTDIEHALLAGSLNSGPTLVDDDDGTSARQMGGFYDVATLRDNGTASLTEELFNDELQYGWEAGARFGDCLTGAAMKRVISTFNDSQTRFIGADEAKIVNAVEVYEGDFHITTISKSRDVVDKAVFFFDREFFSKAWLREPTTELLPSTGDDTKAVVIAELTLEYGNSNAARNSYNFG